MIVTNNLNSGGTFSGKIKDAYDFSEFIVNVFGLIILLFGLDDIVMGGTSEKIDEELNRRR